MDIPMLKSFRRSDLIVRARATNLFWISVVFSAGMALLAGLTLISSQFFISLVAVGLSLALMVVLILLSQGWFKTAANLTFTVSLLGATIVSLINRTGLVEGDLFQVIGFFSLTLFLTGTFTYSTYHGVLMVSAGFATMIFIIFTPLLGEISTQTLSAVNLSANPIALIVIFILMGFVGFFSNYQNGKMLKAMKNALETIEANNAVLENLVEDRTAALRTILDNTGQGFFTFGSDFIVAPEFSRGCTEIFKKSVAGESAVSLLFPSGGDSALEFRQGLDLFFSGRSKAGVIFDLLEKETFLHGRYINLDYREAGEKRILCVLTDVTTEMLLAEKNKKEEERQSLIFRALNNKVFFAAYLQEADELFQSLETFWKKEAEIHEKEAFLRQLHTFKGNAGFFGFQGTQEVAHDFEYALSDSLILGTEVPYQDLYFDLKKAYYQELRTISEILGQDWLKEVGGIIISRSEYSNILSHMKTQHPEELKFIHYLERFNRIPLRDLFSRFPYVAQATADKLGKKLKPMIYEVEDVRVSPERLGTLAEVCIHLVNNMVNHGIEPSYEREAAGKNPAGQVEIKITLENGLLQLIFRDDGRGIDLEAVENSAREKGLLPPDQQSNDQDLLAFLFNDRFSTRKEITDISGRGVGLAAVKEEVTRLGGTIDVNTRMGQGSSFVLSFPLRKSSSLRT